MKSLSEKGILTKFEAEPMDRPPTSALDWVVADSVFIGEYAALRPC